jgi:hypothetical protein
MRRITWLLALVTLGCAAAVPTPTEPSLENALENKVWAKAGEAYAGPGDYERAAAACRGPTDGGLPAVAAAPGAARDFIRCMAREDWILVDAP